MPILSSYALTPYWDIVADIGGMDESLDEKPNPSDERFLARAVAQL